MRKEWREIICLSFARPKFQEETEHVFLDTSRGGKFDVRSLGVEGRDNVHAALMNQIQRRGGEACNFPG